MFPRPISESNTTIAIFAFGCSKKDKSMKSGKQKLINSQVLDDFPEIGQFF